MEGNDGIDAEAGAPPNDEVDEDRSLLSGTGTKDEAEGGVMPGGNEVSVG